MTSKRIIKINKARVMRAALEETLNALQNNLNYMWDAVFINLFEVEGRYVMDEDDTFLIDDGSGVLKELMCEEIEELICKKIMDVSNMVGDSLDATDDNMILILDE